MRSALLFLLLLLTLSGVPSAAASGTWSERGRPTLRVFTPRDYQADPLCQAIAQDADGVMLIANNTDALAFDGVHWQAIPLPAASTGIVQLVRGPAGVVYAAGGSVLGFFRGPVGRKEYVSLLEKLPVPAGRESREYRAAAGSDALYCADETHLWAWRDGRFEAIHGAVPPNARLFSAGRMVYLQGTGTPLYRIAEDRLELVADDPLIRQNEFVRLVVDGDGLRGLTREQGFLAVSRHGVARVSLAADPWLVGKRVRLAETLADGSWLVSFSPSSGNAGLHLSASGELLDLIDESIGLPNRALRAFAVDREGGAWIGLESGLARVDWPGALTLFDAASGLRGFVTTIARHEGTFYAGTIEGLFRLAPGDAATGRVARFERLLSGPVYGLLSDAVGLLVRAQQDLLRVQGDRVESVLPLPGAIGEIVRSRIDPRRFWLNTMQGLHAIYRATDGWRDEGRVARFNDHVASFHECADGTIWIATFNRGLVRMRFGDPAHPFAGPPEIEQFARGRGLPDKFDHCAVYEWHGEPLFFFDGVAMPYRFDAARGQFAPWAEAAQMVERPLFNCWSSAPSGEDLWFTNNDPRPAQHAIFRRREGQGAPQYLPHAVAETAGKIWRFVEESGPDGVLWICSSNGLLRLELSRAFTPPAPLTALLRTDGISDGARVPAADAAPSFVFSAPRFQPGAAVQFQSRLVGLDDDWSPWSTERTRTYAHLPPREYRFEVRARDADGVVSAPAGVGFTLLPPWWRTAWALVPAALMAIALVAAVTRGFVLRALRHRLALLEAQSAVERERLRLARDLHDDIGSGLGRVILFAGEAERAQADPARLTAALGRIRTSAQELVQHAREIVWAVSPQHDTVASLAERLADHVSETFRAANIACTIDVPLDLPAIPLHSEARHSLFLAVKEAVHNTLKYADATQAALRIAASDDTLVVSLSDNGRGFTPGERRGSGHGLRNLAARAEALGGTAQITSAPGQGTTVVLRIPLSVRSVRPSPASLST